MNYQLLKSHIKELFPAAGEIPVSYSNHEDYHYQSSILFSLKKIYRHLNPQSVAHQLLEKYPQYYEKVDITGKGFLSVKYKKFNESVEIEPQHIIVDYCGANIAKEMHIGHIRSMFIGDYVARLNKFWGHNVTLINHVGDWGNQFGYLIHYLMSNSITEYTNKDLTEHYKAAYELYKTNTDFAEKSNQVAYQLQHKKSAKILAVWENMREVSLNAAQETFSQFGLLMNKDNTQGESFYADKCAGLLNYLLNKGIAKKSEDNSVVVFFEDKSPLVLQKSNGNYLYALYDLAALNYRIHELKANKIIYVVDKRQSLHFEQVFDIAQQLGWANNTQLIHLGFGTILGKDKKPLKTKEGQSLYLDVLVQEGKSILSAQEHYESMPEAMKDVILNDTIVGGMKFYDLKFNKQQDYIFDWDYVLNFTGNSAPYIQNAYVRIDSIFYKKFGALEADLSYDNNDYTQEEQRILFECYKIKELVTFEDYASQILTEQTMKVCQLFHKYYDSEKILGHQQEDKKLSVIGTVKNSLTLAAHILGIPLYTCQAKMQKIYKASIT